MSIAFLPSGNGLFLKTTKWFKYTGTSAVQIFILLLTCGAQHSSREQTTRDTRFFPTVLLVLGNLLVAGHVCDWHAFLTRKRLLRQHHTRSQGMNLAVLRKKRSPVAVRWRVKGFASFLEVPRRIAFQLSRCPLCGGGGVGGGVGGGCDASGCVGGVGGGVDAGDCGGCVGGASGCDGGARNSDDNKCRLFWIFWIRGGRAKSGGIETGAYFLECGVR